VSEREREKVIERVWVRQGEREGGREEGREEGKGSIFLTIMGIIINSSPSLTASSEPPYRVFLASYLPLSLCNDT